MALHSQQVERHVLSGLIKNPQIIADLDRFIGDVDFHYAPHPTIYSCLKLTILSGEKVDRVLLAQKIKNLGISFKNDLDIFDYIDSLSISNISVEQTIAGAKELAKLRILREIDETSKKIQNHVKTHISQDIDKTISEVDAIYGERINSYSFNHQPENLHASILELIEETGNNPKDEIGFKTPYPEFNRMWGGLRPANLYAIASRPGQGKTTWINHICSETGRLNNIPVLLLDTEMSSKEIKFRTGAAMSGVPLWYLETGNWRKNAEYVDKVRKTLAGKLKTGGYNVYHFHVANKSIDEICSIVRRWYLQVVGRGKPCVVGYDYIKLTGEKVGQNWAEHQAIGDKIDKLKKLSEEIHAPLVTAIQINRTGESANRDSKDIVDDSSVLALSDRLQWYASFVAIFRAKTDDEVTLDTEPMGTHKLIPTKTRFQGRDAAGHRDRLLRTFPDGTRKYVANFVNFEVDNFDVVERGSLRDCIAAQSAQFMVVDPNSPVVNAETL